MFHAGAVRPRAGRAYQALLTIPLAVPLMVVLLLWKFIYSPGDGLLNTLLRAVGLGGLARDWLGGFDTSLYAIAGLGFPWVTGIGIAGFGMLLLLGGLQAIPAELFDAAAVDGVRPIGRFLRLELPLVAGQLRLIALLTVINTLQGYVPGDGAHHGRPRHLDDGTRPLPLPERIQLRPVRVCMRDRHDHGRGARGPRLLPDPAARLAEAA